MSKRLKITVVIMVLCLLVMDAPQFARVNSEASQDTLILLNGKVEVAYFCSGGGEFPPDWTKVLSFTEAPDTICVRWSGKSPTKWAKWELYKVTNGPDQKIASGNIAAATLADASSKFQIGVKPPLPKFNTNTNDQKYRIVVRSEKISGMNVYSSFPASLVHKPQPPPANPYSCTSAPPNSARKVLLEIPKMTVNSTSSTSGDGDRDELYIKVSRLGPGTQSSEKRLPGPDDYYEAKNGKTVNQNGWTNQDEKHVANPSFWIGTLNHEQSVLLAVTAMEQDNADLKNIKAGIVTAMSAVAGIASSAGGGYGQVVAAVAGAVAGGTQAFVPNTDSHDVVGFVAVKVTNKCGYIQTAWTTFSSANTAEGKVSNDFLDVGTLEKIESRLAVLDSKPQFWPNGVDWSPYTHDNLSDEFWWIAKGTSNSKYTLLLRAKVVPPSE